MSEMSDTVYAVVWLNKSGKLHSTLLCEQCLDRWVQKTPLPFGYQKRQVKSGGCVKCKVLMNPSGGE